MGAAAAALVALGCEPKPPEKSPHELTKEQVEAFAKAFGEAYKAKAVGCTELARWPDEYKSCSKGCDASTWNGAWPGFDWNPGGTSFAHFSITKPDELSFPTESSCGFVATAAMDLNDDKSFVVVRVRAATMRSGKPQPVTIYETKLLGRD